MRILATFDENNYQGTTAILEKYTVRGLIVREGKIAMQYSKDGEYKMPGGGLEEAEDRLEALIREVREETGLEVIADSVVELGEIIEKRRDIFDSSKKYICHSLFYFCKTQEGVQLPLQLTDSELKRGYELKWATAEEICRTNSQIAKDPWIIRDTAFIQMLVDRQVMLPE